MIYFIFSTKISTKTKWQQRQDRLGYNTVVVPGDDGYFFLFAAVWTLVNAVKALCEGRWFIASPSHALQTFGDKQPKKLEQQI